MTSSDITGKGRIPLGEATRGIMELLRTVEPGGFISQSMIAMASGKEDFDACRGNLQSAVIYLEREDGIGFLVVRGEGLKRYVTGDATNTVERTRQSLNRKTKRGLRKLGCEKYEELDTAKKTKFNVGAALLGALTLITRADTTRRLKAATELTQKRLDFTETLKAVGATARNPKRIEDTKPE